MNREVIVGKTKAGAAIAYSVKAGDPLYTIHFKTGGELPKELAGYWNNQAKMVEAINVYLNKDKLCAPDQEKKDYKKTVVAAKNRPNKTKEKKVA